VGPVYHSFASLFENSLPTLQMEFLSDFFPLWIKTLPFALSLNLEDGQGLAQFPIALPIFHHPSFLSSILLFPTNTKHPPHLECFFPLEVSSLPLQGTKFPFSLTTFVFSPFSGGLLFFLATTSFAHSLFLLHQNSDYCFCGCRVYVHSVFCSRSFRVRPLPVGSLLQKLFSNCRSFP